MARTKITPGEPANAAARREVIVASAARLFATKGVASTTVRDIAEAAGILSGSLYYHFGSRDDIVSAVISEALDDLLESYRSAGIGDPDPVEHLRRLIVAAYRHVSKHAEASTLYVSDFTYLSSLPALSYLEGARREVESMWLDVITAGMEAGEFRADVDPRTFYERAAFPIWIMAPKVAASDRSPDDLADEHLDLLLNGLGPGRRGRVRPRT